MGANARGFLLFSFAFSSVLSSPEIAVPSNEAETRTAEVGEDSNNNTVINVAINRCVVEGSCSGGIEKREISYSPREEDGFGPTEEKRARVGFTGMRGKKDNYDGVQADELDDFLEMLEKRARMGFNGMRGKRHDDKRSPMAFHGMRGKKTDEYDYGTTEYLTDEYPPGNEDWEKRSVAFHGMRGRRGNEDEATRVKRYPYGSYEFKRAMGFLGMRGKKAPETWSWEDYKRGLQTGFFGMKGKKAQSGFFGMRGKKTVPGFQGLDNEISTIKTASDQSVSRQERVRRATRWLRNSKKAKNAFFAVRGKKSSGSELNLISGN